MNKIREHILEEKCIFKFTYKCCDVDKIIILLHITRTYTNLHQIITFLLDPSSKIICLNCFQYVVTSKSTVHRIILVYKYSYTQHNTILYMFVSQICIQFSSNTYHNLYLQIHNSNTIKEEYCTRNDRFLQEVITVSIILHFILSRILN